MRPAPTALLLPVALGTLIVPLDSAVNIAFPAITAGFALAPGQLQWLVIAYVLTYGSLMLGIGRLGDLFGHARIFRAGLAWSAIAFLLCAAAPSYPWLLAARVLQGIGAALVIGCGPALLTNAYPEAERPRLLGHYTLAMATGSVLGPALGGWLVASFGWPAVFWFRTPIALAALALLRVETPPRSGPREPFDAAGAALLTTGTVALLLALNQAGRGAWLALPLGLLGLAALVAFVRRSRRLPHPIIAPAHFVRPGFLWLNAANALVNMSGFAVLLFVPFFLTGIAGLAPLPAGLLLATSAAGAMLAALSGGRLLAFCPAPRLARWGIALTGAGLAGMAFWSATTPVPLLAAALMLHGAGLGLLQLAYTDAVLASLPRSERGVAGSLAMVTRTLGVVTAASLLSLLFASLEASQGFQPAFRGVFMLAAAIPVLVLLAGARR